MLRELGDEACGAVTAEGILPAEVEVRRRLLALRLVGQESTVDVEYDECDSLDNLFVAAYRERFGYPPPERPVEVESVRVVASSRPLELPPAEAIEWDPAPVAGARHCLFDGGWRDVPLYERRALEPGAELVGPALVAERFSATVVEANWRCRMDAAGALLIERTPD